MNNIKHIHEVVFLVEKNNQKWSPDDLIEAISNTWGSDVHFGSCSGNAFPKEYALSFLLDRQKVVLNNEGKVALHPSMTLCDGHEDF